MKKFHNKLFGITAAAFGLIWLMAIAAIATNAAPPLPCVGAVCMELVCVILAVAYLRLFHFQPDAQTVEAGSISIVITALYLVATAIANGICVLTGRGYFHTGLVVENLIFVTVYFIAILFAEKYVRSLADQAENLSHKTSPYLAISAKIGVLAATAKDEAIRIQLLQLKEQVDYSTDITTAATAEAEREMSSLLDTVAEQIAEGEEPSLISEKIQQAQTCWRKRCGIASGR